MKKIHWNLITEGYNDKFKTQLTTKKMLKTAYRKAGTIQKMELVIGVNPTTIREEMARQGILIHPKGHKRPTRWDRFKQLTDQDLKNHTDQELANIVRAACGTIVRYRYFRKKGYVHTVDGSRK